MQDFDIWQSGQSKHNYYKKAEIVQHKHQEIYTSDMYIYIYIYIHMTAYKYRYTWEWLQSFPSTPHFKECCGCFRIAAFGPASYGDAHALVDVTAYGTAYGRQLILIRKCSRSAWGSFLNLYGGTSGSFQNQGETTTLNKILVSFWKPSRSFRNCSETAKKKASLPVSLRKPLELS